MPDLIILLVIALIPVGLLIGLAAPTAAAILQVPADHATIQSAIDVASAGGGDTILVAPGTYFENIHFKGKLIVLTSHFMYAKDPQFIFSTIINGSQPGNPDTASVVRITDGENSSAVLQGFTITRGTGTVWTDPHGAGDFREGGGILTEGTSPTIQYNLIIANDAVTIDPGSQSAGGGGIRSGDGSPLILNNVIMNNRGRYGAGIVLNFAGGTIRNNIIAYNTGGEDYAGAGLWKWGASAATTVENNTIVGNKSVLAGGGVLLWQSAMIFRNNIVWGNTAPTFPQIRNNGGTLTISYCNVQGGYAGAGNTNVDPGFGGDYFYLPVTSPCLDSGDPAALYEDVADPVTPGAARWPSLGALRNDMGAYGGPGAFAFERAIIVPDTTIGWTPFDVNFHAYTVYPALAYNWDFGDSGSAAGNPASHTFSTSGLYDITLTLDTGAGTVSITQPQLVAALADSMTTSDAGGAGDVSVELAVYARTTVPLEEIVVPITVTGNLASTLDSFSVAGCRTDYFEVKSWLHQDLIGRRYTLKLRSSNFGTSPAMAPGTGPVVKLYFHMPVWAPPAARDTVSFAGYSNYLPRFANATATYNPRTTTGILNYRCCIVRGNVDGSSGGAVNVADLTYLVNYLFRGGLPADCQDEANVDGSPDGKVLVSDLTYFVNFLFKGGPLPSACS